MNQNQLNLLGTFLKESVEPTEKQFKCVNDTVLIRKIEQVGDIASSKGILLTQQVINEAPLGVICGVGNRVPDYYCKGLTVLFNPNARLEVIVNGATYICMSYREIRCFVNPDFDKPANEIYIPTGNNILLLKTPKGRQVTKAGIEIPVSANNHNHTGMICALGITVTNFNVGDFLLYSSYVDSEITLKDNGTAKPFTIFQEDFILGVLDDGAYVYDKSLTWDEKERERRLKEFAKKSGYHLDGKEA